MGLSAESCRLVADYVDVMSDEPLTNAAVEFMRSGVLFMNVMDPGGRLEGRFADDFVYEDHRSGINYGILDRDAVEEVVKMSWELGSGRPTWSIPEVIAVRGQRIAAMTMVNDFGNDMNLDMMVCVRLDPQLELRQRMVIYDVDARDAAIAEVDRMQAEIDAGDA